MSPRVAAAVCALLGFGCEKRPAEPTPPAIHADAAPVSSAPNPQAPSPLRPLTDARWLEPLELPGGRRAWVSVPLGATQPKPIMLGVHGAGDRPEWACGGWRGVTEAFPFIVCPEGNRGSVNFYWPSTEVLAQVITSALDALKTRFGDYVLRGPALYAGFSAGAIYGAGFVARAPASYPVLMMSEGAYDQLTAPSFAEIFSKGGGKRVLLGCSTGEHCRSRFREASRLLTRAGIEVRLNDAGSVGHNLNGEVVTSLKKDWPWLVENLNGWERFRAAR